ncbi:hypothetical protein N7478_012196 [Penicillium angulare]|uniref:uncharacterized protein n=1 Tax=Penicillium angulare TaxID=116970 RepID=UPI0025401974|nr:uncharacterized protein N7478_012196 [Penicillium angulare]KAJ5259215.1 hypothetical protein N7478_012196 [Penicillium angulare]
MRVTEAVALLAWFVTVSAFSGRHSAHEGLLQIPPSFSYDGVNMYPALHPEHNASDIGHLIPHGTKDLYFSQEGHRPALHGAKHGQLQANFSRPTIVLEHSNHVKEVNCDDGYIEVCFKSPESLETVEKSWKEYSDSESFNVITYHIGCGHRTGEYRSIFVASHPIFHDDCVTVNAELSDEKDEIRDGKLNWGTYQSPHAKRTPVKGHVKVDQAHPAMEMPLFSDLSNNLSRPHKADLTKEAKAVKLFFGTDSINTDVPDQYETGLDFISDEDNGLSKRGLFSWIVEGIQSLIKVVDQVVRTSVELVKVTVVVVIKLAAVTVNLLMVPFGVPFNQSYDADIAFDHRVGGGKIGTDIGSTLGGTDKGLVLSKTGAAVAVECESCGAKANFSFEGELAFSIDKGISKAKVSFINHEPFVFDAIYGVTVDAKAIQESAKKGAKGLKTTIEKEIGSLPFAAIKIPKIITIGPQVVINSAASIYVDAHGEFRAGARFSVSEGEVVLDAATPANNKASGFKPSLEPIFELKKGNIVATADLSIPVGVEVALDVLGGTWKKSIGVYTAPSLFFTAGLSSGEGHKCDNGVEFRVGAKNRVYSSALGIWEYEFKDLGTTFYETGLGCISTKGWDPTQVEPGALFNQVADTFGGEQKLATNKTISLDKPGPIIHEDQEIAKDAESGNKLIKLPKTNGFHLIQDASQNSTLVSGKDGRIYLVENKPGYDISAPWGSMEVDKKIFNYDVFGRLIWFDAAMLDKHSKMVEMGVSPAQNMSRNVRAASFTVLQNDGIEIYGISLKRSIHDERDEFWLPTVCKFPNQGLRLFATYYLVDRKGIALDRQFQNFAPTSWQRDYREEREKYGVAAATDCITVRLTSNRNSTVEAAS